MKCHDTIFRVRSGVYDTIVHYPLLEVKSVEEFYSEKDDVPVKYVCTSAIAGEAFARDIYYRETPHPEHGNRYFSLYRSEIGNLMISNADKIEEAEFVVGQSAPCRWEYSAHRHDYHPIRGAALDGGRAYFRMTYSDSDNKPELKNLKVVNGEFVEV